MLDNSTNDINPSWTVQWRFLPIATIILTVLMILLNGAVLAPFIRGRVLITPFNIYLINLLVTNVMHALCVTPLDIVNMVSSEWHYSFATCTFYLYVQRIGDAVMINSHVLISFNRIWAMTAPVSYRLYHSRRVAVGLCIGLWVWVNCILLPQIVMDAMYYRHGGCRIAVRPQWILATLGHFFVFVLPWVFMIVSYPVLLFLRKRQQKRVYQVDANLIALRRFRAESTTSDSGKRKRSSNAFTILTLLTISVTVCWSPLLVLFTMTFFMDYFDSTFYQIGSVLFLLEPVCDPVYFAIALHDLRNIFGLRFRSQ